MRPGVLVLAALAAAPLAGGQGVATFEASVEYVRLSVTASRGAALATELDAADFKVLEDGVPQKLEIFNRRSAPLSLVLLLDTSGSMKEPLRRLQDAASSFVAALGPEDSVEVAQLTSRLTVLQGFTADKALLGAAVLRTQPAGTTALYNALYSSIRTLRERRRGDELKRQAIVVLSDGVDNASIVSDDQVLDLARRNEVALYAIGLDPGLQDQTETTPALALLKAMAFETGGRLVLPRRDLKAACAEVAEELRHQYTLGYASTNPARNGRWRRLEVRARRGRSDFEVRHRLGYYAAGARAAAARVTPPASVADETSADAATREAFYGAPVPVAIVDLLESPGDYEGRAVTFSGSFDSVAPSRGLYALQDGTSRLEIRPASALAAWLASHADALARQRVEVSGVFRRQTATSGTSAPAYLARVFVVQPPAAAVDAAQPRTLTLQALQAAAGALDGTRVRVVGRFRGRNLYRDLPAGSQAGEKDWVLRDGAHSVWITGAAPAGEGFRLEPMASEGTRQWLAVVGRPRTVAGTVAVSADSVEIVAPPAAGALVTSRIQARGYEEPIVTFALPDDGERIAPDTRFVIQFSAPMDPASLEGRVVLDYEPATAGPAFDRVTVSYSDETRHVIVDPGAVLRRGRTLRCRLLAGIVDVSGRPLGPRDPKAEAGTAVEELRFRVE